MSSIPIWPFIMIMSLSAMVLYVRAVNPNSWKLIFRSTYSPRALSQMLREENFMNSSYAALLVFNFFLSLALFLFNYQAHYGKAVYLTYPQAFYPVVLFLLLLYFTLKISLVYGLQLIFEERFLFNEYIALIMNTNVVLGIWLLPLNLVFAYGLDVSKPFVLSCSMFLLLGVLILQIIRLYETGSRANIKWYNIILYLCALEIMPIILIMTLTKEIGIILDLG